MEEQDSLGICKNCGTKLQGEFCHSCGQSSVIVRRPAKELIEDTFSYLFQWDTRLMHTLQYLFFKPGKLSADWVEGKRMRYVPPFRLYIISSFILFLLVGIATHGGSVGFQQVSDESTNASEELLRAEAEAIEQDQWLSAFILRGANRALEDPEAYLRKILTNLPKAAFLLLPVFALLHMATEISKDRFYIDYLVFSLHFHSFAFLLLALILVIGFIYEPAGDVADILNLCTPVYAIIGIRRLNPQGWTKSCLKGILIFGGYSIILIIGIAVFFTLLLFI